MRQTFQITIQSKFLVWPPKLSFVPALVASGAVLDAELPGAESIHENKKPKFLSHLETEVSVAASVRENLAFEGAGFVQRMLQIHNCIFHGFSISMNFSRHKG
jgi:hypothetical protein